MKERLAKGKNDLTIYNGKIVKKLSQQTSLKCFYTSANSLVQKMDELRDRALEKDYDIIAVVETWAHSGIGDAELTIEGFDMHRADRKGKRGDGVVTSNLCQGNINVVYE